MTCDTWSERIELESNITLRFLTFCAAETLLLRTWIEKCRRSCFQLFLEPLKFYHGLVLICENEILNVS